MADLPDRFKRKGHPMMPPPGAAHPGIMIAVGVSKKKPGEEDEGSPDDILPPKGADSAPGADSDGRHDGGDLATPEEAIVLRADDKTCQSCENWTPESGMCSKVQGSPFDGSDRCLRYYEPVSGGDSSAAPTPPATAASGGMS